MRTVTDIARQEKARGRPGPQAARVSRSTADLSDGAAEAEIALAAAAGRRVRERRVLRVAGDAPVRRALVLVVGVGVVDRVLDGARAVRLLDLAVAHRLARDHHFPGSERHASCAAVP